jgi:hypothetical protein
MAKNNTVAATSAANNHTHIISQTFYTDRNTAKMCGSSSGNTTTDDSSASKPVPPAALAAALVMIAVGIVIILTYGSNQKKAWRPERTYVMDEHPQETPNELYDPGSPETDAANQLMDEAVQGLDDGLSTTLKTALIADSTTA